MQFKIFTIITLCRSVFLLYALIFGATMGSTNQEDATPPALSLPGLTLETQETYPLDGLAATHATVSPSDLAKVSVSDEGITITALRPGAGELKLQNNSQIYKIPLTVKSGTSRASGHKPSNTSLISSLKKIKGIQTTTTSGQTIVRGEVLSRKAYQELLGLYRDHYPNLRIETSLAPGIKASLMEQALSALRQQNLADVHIASAGHRYFLYGAVSASLDVERALESVRPVLPSVENRLPLPIDPEPTIFIQVSMLELSRRAHKELGLSWPRSSPLAQIGSGGSSLNFGWDVTLRHLSATGLARVLAEPSLAIRLGAEAELSAGGEIPIRLTERFENRLVWKHYGLKLKLKVKSLAGRFLRVSVNTESSHLDSATSVGGTPGLLTNKLNTEIDAELGLPVLLTGLFQASQSKDVDKLPILGDIPLLGELFKSRDFRKNESELLIALIPRRGRVTTKLPLRGVNIDADTAWSLGD